MNGQIPTRYIRLNLWTRMLLAAAFIGFSCSSYAEDKAQSLLDAEASGDFQKALTIYQQYVKEAKLQAGGDLNAQFWYKKGDCEARLKMFTEAVDSFTKSYEIAQKGDELWNWSSMYGAVYCLQELNRPDEANKILQKLRTYLAENELVNDKLAKEKLLFLEQRAKSE